MKTAIPTYEDLLAEVAVVKEENAVVKEENCQTLKQQLEWFQKQFFGPKSERLISDSPQQLVLLPRDDTC